MGDSLKSAFQRLEAAVAVVHERINNRSPASVHSTDSYLLAEIAGIKAEMKEIRKTEKAILDELCEIRTMLSSKRNRHKDEESLFPTNYQVIKEIRVVSEQMSEIERKEDMQNNVNETILKELQEIRRENAELRNEVAEIKKNVDALRNENSQKIEKPIVEEIIGTWEMTEPKNVELFYQFRRYERHDDIILGWASMNRDQLSNEQGMYQIEISKNLKDNMLLTDDLCRYIKNGHLHIYTNDSNKFAAVYQKF